MTLISLPSCDSFWLPAPPQYIIMNPGFLSMTVDATGEKCAFVGRVKFAARTGNKVISKIHFRTGTINKATSGASIIRCSLQAVQTATVTFITPAEVQDQFRDFAISTLTNDTWTTTGLITSDGTDVGTPRTVAHNELLAIVFEFDPSGRQGSTDVFTVSGYSTSPAIGSYGQGTSLTKISGAWATNGSQINTIIEFDDGSFGTLAGAWPLSAAATITYNSDSAADEWSNDFELPFPCSTDSWWAYVWATGNAANFEAVLYQDTTVLQSILIDANAVHSVAGTRLFVQPWPTEQALVANTRYKLAFKPTSANNIRLDYFDVAAAGHLVCHGWGNFPMNSRANGGAWNDTGPTTRRLLAGLGISANDNGISNSPVGRSLLVQRGSPY